VVVEWAKGRKRPVCFDFTIPKIPIRQLADWAKEIDIFMAYPIIPIRQLAD